MTDSNVLRLIRRYDPVAASTIGIKPRRSLESTRNVFETNPSKSISSLSSNISSSTSSVLPQRTLNSTHEHNSSLQQSSTPRLQRQKAIYDQDSSSSNVTTSIRPILKYTSSSPRTELNIQPKKTEPLTIEVEPHVSPIIKTEKPIPYQPLITTGTKRVCAKISKSEWDLRLQTDSSSPIIPSPSPPPPPSSSFSTATTVPIHPRSSRATINQQQEKKESYRPLFGRSKSSIGINNDYNEQNNNTDDFDEISAPITSGSCVGKLKQLFATKSSLDLTNSSINKQNRDNSIDSDLNRRVNTNGTNINKSDLKSSTTSLIQKVPNSNSIESQTRIIPNGILTKPTAIIQEAAPTSSPLLKRPILKSQKTIDRYVQMIFLIEKYKNRNKQRTEINI